jgi:outer membrane protein TolC
MKHLKCRKNKSMRSKTYLFMILLLFLSFRGMGQELLTLERCRELAVQKSEDLRIAGKQVDQAEAEKAAVRTMRFPNFSASALGLWLDKDIEIEMLLPTKKPDPTTGELNPNLLIHPSTGMPVTGADGNPLFAMYAWLPLAIDLGGAYMAGVSVEQPLYTGGKITAGNKMADIGLDMANENLKLQRMNILDEADRAYWTFVSIKEKVVLAEMAVAMLDTLVSVAEDSYDVGIANRNDLLKARVEKNKATLELHKAKNGLELCRMNLCRVIGRKLDAPLETVDTHIDINTLSFAEEENISKRPEYQLMEKNILLQEENIKQTRADYLPFAGISAGYSHIGGIEFSGEDFDNTSLHVMASLKIPIFHWGEGKNKTKAAKIEREIRELQLKKNSQQMELEIHQARLSLQEAFKRIELAEEALKQAEENLRVSHDNYDVGMENISNLLVAQTRWQEAFSNLIEAKADFKRKETAYLKAIGQLGE